MLYGCHLFTISKKVQDYTTFFSIILSISLFCGCQEKTPELKKTTNAEIYVRYLADEMKLTAECTFTEISENDVSKKTFDNVTFFNQLMQPRKISEQQTRYQVTIKRHQPESNYEIKYWNKEEKQPGSIEITLPVIDSFQIAKNLKVGEELKIFGSPLLKNEKIILLFTNESKGTKTLNLKNVNLENPIIINQEQLSTLPSGKNEVYLIRTKIENTKGIKKVFEFYSKTTDIEIIK